MIPAPLEAVPATGAGFSLAEKSWSPARAAGWDEYRVRLAAHGRLWDRRGWDFFRSSLVDWGAGPWENIHGAG